MHSATAAIQHALADAQVSSGHRSDVFDVDGMPADGREWTQRLQRDSTGKVVTEYWVIQGAGHAWSGGSARGSYTDPKGPNATTAMLRFFLEHGARR